MATKNVNRAQVQDGVQKLIDALKEHEHPASLGWAIPKADSVADAEADSDPGAGHFRVEVGVGLRRRLLASELGFELGNSVL